MAKTKPQADLKVDQVAGCVYSLIDAYNTIVDGDEPRPRWDAADEHVQAETIKAIIDLRDNPGTTPESNHALWCEVMQSRGWRYGEQIDRERKEHPNLVPFHQLPEPAQRISRAIHCVVYHLLGV